ncbi:MAG TPA: hypothetical protein VHR66_20140 [Gemmataceae bacterium]|nr:hypothetical protein [Gemmataceae bacterium]
MEIRFASAVCIDINQQTSFRSIFANVPPLDVSWKLDAGMATLVHFLALMHVAQRPIVVAARNQLVEGTRGVVCVVFTTGKRSVQHTNVEPTGYRVWVVCRKVVELGLSSEALSVKCDSKMIERDGVRLFRWKGTNIVWQSQLRRDSALCIVIAGEHNHGNSGPSEFLHLIDEEESGVVVLPIPVVVVTGQNHEFDAPINCQANQIRECLAGCAANCIDGRSFIGVQSEKWAVEMNIGGVEECEHLLF